MKKTKKNNVNMLILLIAILGVVLIGLFGLILWMELGGEDPAIGTEPQQTMSSEAETTGSTEATEGTTILTSVPTEPSKPSRPQNLVTGTTVIETPYLTLRYPESFEDILAVVHTPGNPYILEFYTVLEGRSSQRLFDVVLEEGERGGNLGVIESDVGKISASLVIYSFNPDNTWTDGEINTVLAMQEASNDLIEQIMALRVKDEEVEGPVISTETPDPGLADYMAITTPYCTLYYPLTWQAYLQTEHTEKVDSHHVQFFAKLDNHDKVALFTVMFGGDEGEQVGAILNENGDLITVVNTLMEELDTEGFTEAEMTILYEMQEAINEMISKMPLAS